MSSKKLGLDISMFERLVEHTSQLKPHQLLVSAPLSACLPDTDLKWTPLGQIVICCDLGGPCRTSIPISITCFVCEQVQRRMRPAIAEIIRKEIYPALKDGPNVLHYPDVSGTAPQPC